MLRRVHAASCAQCYSGTTTTAVTYISAAMKNRNVVTDDVNCYKENGVRNRIIFVVECYLFLLCICTFRKTVAKNTSSCWTACNYTCQFDVLCLGTTQNRDCPESGSYYFTSSNTVRNPVLRLWEFKGKIFLLRTMKEYWGSNGIAVLILNIGTRWSWVVKITPRPLYLREITLMLTE
jgi:hypothetical protein